MMLSFIYIMLSAKPISLRRLCALFVLSVAAAAMALSILRNPHVLTTALLVASAVTFAAWVFPLIRIVGTMRRRGALDEVLSVVSITVQLSYCASLLLAPAVLVLGLPARLHADGLRLGAVSQAVALACIGAPLLLMATEAWRKQHLINRGPVRKMSVWERRGPTWHRAVPAFRTRRS